MTGEPMEHPAQERDRMRGWPAVAAMVAGVAVVAAAVVPAWWLLRAELTRRGADRGAGIGVTLGPPPEQRERLPRRVGGLLQTQIERGEGGRAPEEVTGPRPGPPERWEWVDREAGIARMPIDRAIELVLERYAEEAAAAPRRGGDLDAPGEPVPVEPSLDEVPSALDEPPGGER